VSEIAYPHRIGAHCESSCVTGLLQHAGLDLSEPMVFGISGAIFFGYFRTRRLPFPTFVVRNQPGKIRAKAGRHLGVRFAVQRFRRPDRAARALDTLLDRGIPVAVQVDLFYLDYVPSYARAHFNGHHLVVVGKRNGNYLVSDPYTPVLAQVAEETLRSARYAEGPFAPRGRMFHVVKAPDRVDLERAILKGIRYAAFNMLRLPLGFLGIKGIRRCALRLPDWPAYARDTEHLSHEIMMIAVLLEDRGTGGAGFRFLYATFLREAAEVTGRSELADLAKRMMENGDRWREVSLLAARMGKRRDLGPENLKELGAAIGSRAEVEQALFADLARAARRRRVRDHARSE